MKMSIILLMISQIFIGCSDSIESHSCTKACQADGYAMASPLVQCYCDTRYKLPSSLMGVQR